MTVERQVDRNGDRTTTRRTLCILAGYPAVGKSTLLRRSIRERVPLFGSEYDSELSTFRVPQKLNEWEYAPAEILEKKYWFSEVHLPSISKMVSRIDCALVHVDLLRVVSDKSLVSVVSPLSAAFPRTTESLAKDEENRNILSNVFNHTFLSHWDTIAVNTYSLPFAVNCRRLHNSRIELGPFTVLFDGGRQAEAIHASIHRAWWSIIASWKPSDLLVTSEVDSRIVIRKVAGRGKRSAGRSSI